MNAVVAPVAGKRRAARARTARSSGPNSARVERPEDALGGPARRLRLRVANPVRLPVERGHVEVDRENDRERDEGGRREDRLSGDVAERGEQRRVHDEVGERVQIPADERDLTGGARELAV